jgi:hypothetical protein
MATVAHAPAVFAEDALYAYWDGHGDETAERTLLRGREQITGALAYCRLERLLSLQDDENWFVEGVCLDSAGHTAASFGASAQLDAAGQITRCLAFHCPPVPPPPRSSETEPGCALEILERYFRHLVAGELAETCECFSVDCLYSHPPDTAGGPRAEFRGRDELLEGFRTTRGPRSSRPEILCCAQRGADAFIEGVVNNDAGPKGSFVSSVTLDADGLIRRYIAFYTSSRIPRR